LRSFEELRSYAVLEQDPAAEDVTQHDREESDRVFETRTVVNGLGVLIHHEQADRGRRYGDYQTTVGDSVHNPFQVNVLKGPDGGTHDDPKDTVRERMHSSIYPPEHDAKCVNDDANEVDTVTRR